MRRYLSLFLMAIGLLALAVAGFWWFGGQRIRVLPDEVLLLVSDGEVICQREPGTHFVWPRQRAVLFSRAVRRLSFDGRDQKMIAVRFKEQLTARVAIVVDFRLPDSCGELEALQRAFDSQRQLEENVLTQLLQKTVRDAAAELDGDIVHEQPEQLSKRIGELLHARMTTRHAIAVRRLHLVEVRFEEQFHRHAEKRRSQKQAAALKKRLLIVAKLLNAGRQAVQRVLDQQSAALRSGAGDYFAAFAEDGLCTLPSGHILPAAEAKQWLADKEHADPYRGQAIRFEVVQLTPVSRLFAEKAASYDGFLVSVRVHWGARQSLKTMIWRRYPTKPAKSAPLPRAFRPDGATDTMPKAAAGRSEPGWQWRISYDQLP